MTRLLSEIYCKIAMLEQAFDGHGLLENAAVGVVLEGIKLAESIKKYLIRPNKYPFIWPNNGKNGRIRPV